MNADGSTPRQITLTGRVQLRASQEGRIPEGQLAMEMGKLYKSGVALGNYIFSASGPMSRLR